MPETPGTVRPLGIFGGTFDPPHIAHLRLAVEARESLNLAEVVFIPAGAPRLREAPQAARHHRLAMVERAIAGTPGFLLDATEILGAGPSYSVATLERLRAKHGQARPLVLLLGADAFARLEGWHRWRELFALAHLGVATRPGFALDAKKVPAGMHSTGAGESAAEAHVSVERTLSGDRRRSQKLGADETAIASLTPVLASEWAARCGEAGDLAASPAGRIVPFSIPALELSASAIRARLAAGRNVRHLVTDAVLDYIGSNSLYRTSHGR